MENTNLPNYMTDNRGIQIESATKNPDGSFTVSEQDAEKLKAMAMANSNSELTPEMKSAMDQIPDNVHNYICYDEAKKNAEKYQQEATEFTNNLVPDEATRELLDEAEATTSLSNFDFGEIDEYCEKLGGLSFLEAVSYKKKIDAEIARWKSCKSMLKAISDLKLDDSVNRELMKINAMEDYNFLESIDDFESHYEENLAKLEKISAKLVSIVNEHKNEMDSTKFLSEEMIHLMEGKLNKLDHEGLNYDFNKKKMEIVIEAFKNRLDLTYLTNKLEIYLKTNKANIRRDLRMAEDHRSRAKFLNDLAKFFSEDILYALYERLMWSFNDDAVVVYIMMAFLAKIMNTEKRSSRDVWAKVFILNLADMYNHIFDIDGAEADPTYADRIHDTFHPMIKEFILKQKDIKLMNNKIYFGVRTPKSTKKELIESYDAVPVDTEPTDEISDDSIIMHDGVAVKIDSGSSMVKD